MGFFSSGGGSFTELDPTALKIANNLSDLANAATARTNLGVSAAADVVLRDGSQAMTGNLDAGTNKIVNVVDPTAAQDAATKSYADSIIDGADFLADSAPFQSLFIGSNPPSVTGIANTILGIASGTSLTSGFENVIVGNQNSGITTGNKNVKIGSGTNLGNALGAVWIGARTGQNSPGNFNTIIGSDAGVGTTGSSNIIIGSAYNSITNPLPTLSSTGQVAIGNSYIKVTRMIFNGWAGATPSPFEITTSNGFGTDIAGSDFTLTAGGGTGTGVGGKFALRTSPAATTGSSINAPVTRVEIASDGTVDFPSAAPVILPRLTTTQRDSLTPVNGMMIYNTTLAKFQGYEAGAWANLI